MAGSRLPHKPREGRLLSPYPGVVITDLVTNDTASVEFIQGMTWQAQVRLTYENYPGRLEGTTTVTLAPDSPRVLFQDLRLTHWGYYFFLRVEVRPLDSPRRPLELDIGVLDRLRILPIYKNGLKTCIKFCVKNETKCADAFRMLTVAYGEATLDRSNVYRWYKMFSEGREDVNDEERAGRPSTSTTDEKINEVEKMILANRRITVREVAEDLNISIGSRHSIFINDLGMRRVAAKFVPKLLNCDQKQHRMNIANEMLDSVRDDPNLLRGS
ncbi:hypothetical protein LAZ67_1000439 [Cordylochernes scorpioides]|uniref:Mos1 transposase HTH domain-containing protein n=1 Tax=Cordylochernes scorpioides TaxID=51811 RepID=A0ABY6JUV2_9ARAC|nr:hypothetical protein LAZ67_1000439 [Cordylochernes scorpioides]